jgi:hypothetical protein
MRTSTKSEKRKRSVTRRRKKKTIASVIQKQMDEPSGQMTMISMTKTREKSQPGQLMEWGSRG